ncbi:hypothetical protein BT69DRAFT_1302527 [Atractiella rhizophila]|nr:hypothetical protein BT69DRAFT_1302527 [Atractiella rhizophila]
MTQASTSKRRISFCPAVEPTLPTSIEEDDELFQALLDDENSLVEELHAKLEKLRADRIALEATVEQESSELVSRLQAQLRALLSSTPQPYSLSPPDPATPQTPFFEPGSPNSLEPHSHAHSHSAQRSEQQTQLSMRRGSVESLQSENRELRNRLEEYEALARDGERWRRELIELRERCGIGTDDLHHRLGDPTPGLALRYPATHRPPNTQSTVLYSSSGPRSRQSFSGTNGRSRSASKVANGSTSPSPRLPSFTSLSTSPLSPISPAEVDSTSSLPSAARTTLTTPSTSYVPTLVPPSSPQQRSPSSSIVTLLPLTSALGGNTRVASAVGFSRHPRRPSASTFLPPHTRARAPSTSRVNANGTVGGVGVGMSRSRGSSQSRVGVGAVAANMPLFLSDEDLSDGFGEIMRGVETPIRGGSHGVGEGSGELSRKSSGKSSWVTVEDEEVIVD